MQNNLLFDKLGVLLSSDGTVYNIKTVKKFLDYISELGYNTFYLEITAGYELDGEPFFGYLRGKYDNRELKEIDLYAKAKGITVIPAVQTLAHMGHIFRFSPYIEMRDIDQIMLVGEPKVYELIEKIIKTMSECFSSKIIHLGMDEAFKLGRGKYYDIHGDRNRIDIMQEHVERVLKICDKYNVIPEMWGDMYIRMAYGAYEKGPMTIDKSEEVSRKIAPNVKIHYWDYYSLEKEHYIEFIKKFKKITDNVVFDGGVWDYIGFEPDNSYSIKATEVAFNACFENGIKEVTVTSWGGDGTNETSIWAIMPTLVAASEFARGNHDLNLIKEKFKQLMHIDFDAFIALESADKLKAREQDNIQSYLCNPTKYLLFNDVFAGIYDSTVDESERKVFINSAKKLQAYTNHSEWGGIFKTAKALALLMEYKFDLGVKTRKAYKEGNKKELIRLAKKIYPLVVKRIEVFYKAFREQWYAENKSNGFEIQDIRFGGLINRLKNCRRLLLDYCSGKIDKLEELEQNIVDYYDGTDELVKGALFENAYSDEASVLTL